MGEGFDLVICKFSELVAHHVHGLIKTGVFDRGPAQRFWQQRSGRRRGGRCQTVSDQRLDSRHAKQRLDLGERAKLVRADGFTLVHWNAADNVCQITAEQNLREQGFNLTKLVFRFQTGRPMAHLAECFNIGDRPGKAVGQMLLVLKRCAVWLAIRSECAGSVCLKGVSIHIQCHNGIGHNARKSCDDRTLRCAWVSHDDLS